MGGSVGISGLLIGGKELGILQEETERTEREEGTGMNPGSLLSFQEKQEVVTFLGGGFAWDVRI